MISKHLNFTYPDATQPVVYAKHNDQLPAITLRTFTPSLVPLPSEAVEFLHSPTGAAFLEWNSRIGVPKDVWAVISTAKITCKTCKFTRSFNGNDAHCDKDGNCLDKGEPGAEISN